MWPVVENYMKDLSLEKPLLSDRIDEPKDSQTQLKPKWIAALLTNLQNVEVHLNSTL